MVAKDFRIGNWVIVWKSTLEIDEINLDGINCCEGFSDGVNYKHIKPIILTKKWYEKLGFINSENENGDYNFQLKNVALVKSKNGCIVWFSRDSDDYFQSIMSVKYVHQLQNLYFALTGEELEAKC